MNGSDPHFRLFSGTLNQVSSPELVYQGPPGKHVTMPAKALLYEIDQLKGVSSRLDSLANQHPIMEDEIVTISGNIHRTAVLLEVLLAIRLGPPERI